MSAADAIVPLVTVGYQVQYSGPKGGAERLGRVYQVRQAADDLCALAQKSGYTDAHVVSVQKFEGDKKVIK